MLILGYTYATLPINNLINQLFDEVVYFKSYDNQLLSICNFSYIIAISLWPSYVDGVVCPTVLRD